MRISLFRNRQFCSIFHPDVITLCFHDMFFIYDEAPVYLYKFFWQNGGQTADWLANGQRFQLGVHNGMNVVRFDVANVIRKNKIRFGVTAVKNQSIRKGTLFLEKALDIFIGALTCLVGKVFCFFLKFQRI